MEALSVLGSFFTGVGIILLGCGLMWFVSVYSEKKK